MTERSLRKSLALHDLSGSDWSTRMLRARAETEEFSEREAAVREARRRAEQQRAQTNSTDNFNRAVDARVEGYLHEIYNEAIGQVLANGAGKRATEQIELERKNYEARIAALEKQLEARQSLSKNFRFARDHHGDAGKPSVPIRTKIH